MKKLVIFLKKVKTCFNTMEIFTAIIAISTCANFFISLNWFRLIEKSDRPYIGINTICKNSEGMFDITIWNYGQAPSKNIEINWSIEKNRKKLASGIYPQEESLSVFPNSFSDITLDCSLEKIKIDSLIITFNIFYQGALNKKYKTIVKYNYYQQSSVPVLFWNGWN